MNLGESARWFCDKCVGKLKEIKENLIYDERYETGNATRISARARHEMPFRDCPCARRREPMNDNFIKMEHDYWLILLANRECPFKSARDR